MKSPTTVEDACETKPFVKVARLETPSVEESVAAPVTPSVLENVPAPPVNVPNVPALEKRFVELAVVLKSAVEVVFVKVTLPEKTFTPLHVFELASKVEDAAVMVIDPPRLNVSPLIVPNTPVMNPDPTDVVDTSLPFSSVARRALVKEEKYWLPVVVAFTASVDDAINCVPFSHSGVVVD